MSTQVQTQAEVFEKYLIKQAGQYITIVRGAQGCAGKRVKLLRKYYPESKELYDIFNELKCSFEILISKGYTADGILRAYNRL